MPSGQAVGGPPFVGRRTELDALISVLARLGLGRGGIALVTGGAGIGKSRLVATALDEAEGDTPAATRTGFGECLPDLLMPPLWPVSRAVASASRAEPGLVAGSAKAWADLEALLRPTAGAAERAGGASFSPGWDRLAVLGDIVDHLVAASRSAPVVLVLEDVHWADPETVALLRLLAPELGRCPLVVLATARHATDDDHAAALAGLTGSPSTQVVALGPLSVADVEQYLADGSVRAIATEVLALSGGLPLLLPVAIGAAHGGSEDTSAAASRSVEPARLQVDVPSLVRRLTVSLTDEHVAVLEGASLVTTGLDAEVAAAAAGVTVAGAGDATASAVRAGVLTTAAEGGGLTFVHDLVRESLSSRLSPERATAAHRRLAGLLAGRTGIPAVRVAAHWDAAGADPEACSQAATWWQRAADESARLRAYEDAAALQAKAVLAAEGAGSSATRLAETSLAAARAWYRAGRYAEAVAAADLAAGHAGTAGRPDLVADAALAVGWVSYPAAQEVITRLAKVALDQGGASISDATRARLLAQQVAMLGNYAEAHGGPQAAEAMALARRSGDPAARLEAIGARMASIPEIGSAAEQRALAEEAVDISSRLREPVPELLAHTWLLRAAVELGAMDLATEELLRLRRIADATRLPLAEWHALRASVAMAILRGDFAEIPERHERANAVARESGDIVAASVGNAAVFEVAQRRGVPIPDPEAILRMLDHAPVSTLIEAPKALLLHQIGRTDEARVIYDRLVPLLGGHPEYRPWWPVMYILLDLAQRFGDVEAGALLAVEQEPYSRGVVGGLGTSTVWFIGNPNRHLGRALALAGRHDEAMTAFETALACDVRMGARPDVALGRLEMAALLARSDGDRGTRTTRLRSALEQVRRAAEECRTLDMPGHVARADALAAELARNLAQDHPLSPREREVVDLVVEGLTNQQVAARLFLSERTVESHVRAALMKLGCRNRAELIRLETGDRLSGGSRGGSRGRSPRGLA